MAMSYRVFAASCSRESAPTPGTGAPWTGACAAGVPDAGVGAGAADGAAVCPGGVCALPGCVAGCAAPEGSGAGGALAVCGGCGAGLGLGGTGRISHTPATKPTTMRAVMMSVPPLEITGEIGGAPVERAGGRAAGATGGGAARAGAVAADVGGAVRAGAAGAAGATRAGAAGAADEMPGGVELGGAAAAGLASTAGASVREAKQHSQRVALGLLANPQYGQAVAAMGGVSRVAGYPAPRCWRPVYLKTCAKQWPVRPQCGPRLAPDRARR